MTVILSHRSVNTSNIVVKKWISLWKGAIMFVDNLTTCSIKQNRRCFAAAVLFYTLQIWYEHTVSALHRLKAAPFSDSAPYFAAQLFADTIDNAVHLLLNFFRGQGLFVGSDPDPEHDGLFTGGNLLAAVFLNKFTAMDQG